MEISISYSYAELQHEIDLLTYYKGESMKRDDVNADIPQTSSDNEEIIKSFLDTAGNEVAALAAKRMKEIVYNRTGETLLFKLSPTGEENGYLIPLLRKSLSNCLVSHVLYLWMLTVREDWAQSYYLLYSTYHSSLEKLLATLYHRPVRRRSTNLAGI